MIKKFNEWSKINESYKQISENEFTSKLSRNIVLFSEYELDKLMDVLSKSDNYMLRGGNIIKEKDELKFKEDNGIFFKSKKFYVHTGWKGGKVLEYDVENYNGTIIIEDFSLVIRYGYATYYITKDDDNYYYIDIDQDEFYQCDELEGLIKFLSEEFKR